MEWLSTTLHFGESAQESAPHLVVGARDFRLALERVARAGFQKVGAAAIITCTQCMHSVVRLGNTRTRIHVRAHKTHNAQARNGSGVRAPRASHMSSAM